ncbi:Zn(2)-C6 fungal-type domain-containing protein [Mycena kentingensis (nom. inval.)]|nr:Zn(2)-C6 fungal-type domain-containing protein [Mycena kentingensis (nom. inval.)]
MAPQRSHSSSPRASTSVLNVPDDFKKRRRSIIACTNCRRRKTRCYTTEEFPESPCERCADKGLQCCYKTIGEQREQDAQADSSGGEASPPSTPPLLLRPAPGAASTEPAFYDRDYDYDWRERTVHFPAAAPYADAYSAYVHPQYEHYGHGYSHDYSHDYDYDYVPQSKPRADPAIVNLRPWVPEDDLTDAYFTQGWDMTESSANANASFYGDSAASDSSSSACTTGLSAAAIQLQ